MPMVSPVPARVSPSRPTKMEHVAALSPERKTDAQFARALVDEIRKDAIYADRCQNHGYAGENPEHEDIGLIPAHIFPQLSSIVLMSVTG
jgi:hypothetical protein